MLNDRDKILVNIGVSSYLSPTNNLKKCKGTSDYQWYLEYLTEKLNDCQCQRQLMKTLHISEKVTLFIFSYGNPTKIMWVLNVGTVLQHKCQL